MRITTFGALLSLLVALAGCNIGGPAAAPQLRGPEPLVFYSWAGHMPQDILDLFQQEYGIPVEYINYDDQDEALGELRAGKRHFDTYDNP